MLTDILPPTVRRHVYALVAALGVIFGAVQAAYLAVGDQPAWLTATLAAYAVVAAAVGVTARANTPAGPFAVVELADGTTATGVLPASAEADRLDPADAPDPDTLPDEPDVDEPTDE